MLVPSLVIPKAYLSGFQSEVKSSGLRKENLLVRSLANPWAFPWGSMLALRSWDQWWALVRLDPWLALTRLDPSLTKSQQDYKTPSPFLPFKIN
eukprot:UN13197